MNEEERASKKYVIKPSGIVSRNATTLKGSNIRQRKERTAIMSQTEIIPKLNTADTEKEFRSHPALAQYVGVNTRHAVIARIQLLAAGKEGVTEEEFIVRRKTIRHMTQTHDTGLICRRLDIPTMHLVLLTYSCFGDAGTLQSQLRYVLLTTEPDGMSNIILYGSTRSR